MNQFCKTTVAGCLLLLLTSVVQAQVMVHIGAGGQLFIGANTAVSFDSLLVVPSSNGFLLSENDISKLSVPNYSFPGTYVRRVYCFSKPVPDYSGSLGIFYNDKQASGVDESKLLIQAYTGYGWTPQRDRKSRDVRHNATGVLGVRHLSFSELLAGYRMYDTLFDSDGRLAPVALATGTSALILLYPNPAVSVVTVQVNGGTAVTSVQLYNAGGKLLMTKTGSTSNRYTFNVSSLAGGVYSVVIETAGGREVKTFVKL